MDVRGRCGWVSAKNNELSVQHYVDCMILSILNVASCMIRIYLNPLPFPTFPKPSTLIPPTLLHVAAPRHIEMVIGAEKIFVLKVTLSNLLVS